MTRPGFVLEVDDRTPALVVHEGEHYRLERFPLGTRAVPSRRRSPARSRAIHCTRCCIPA
jgi:hypothetical protein